MESLTPDIQEVISLLTLDPTNPPKIVGSFKYKVHEYPADIDLYEGISGCCTIDTTKQRIVRFFKQMAEKIQKRRFTYLGDFKAGVDERYYIDIGTYDSKTNKIYKYDRDNIIHAIAMLYENKLLTKEEAINIIHLVYKKPTAIQYQELRDAIRKKYVLRWTLKEILAGYKILPLHQRISLSTAISQGTIVKTDLWVLIDDRFMEVTNWFMLTAIVNGTTFYLSEKPDMYQKSLEREILLLKNPALKKNMKLAKRMWLYAISNHDNYTIKQLYPLFSSPIAKLYQIQSELEILVNMLEKLSDPPYHLISKQIAQFKTRIGTIPDIYLNEDNEREILRNIDVVLRTDMKKNQEIAITRLNSTYELIRDIVDIKAKDFLRKNIPGNKLVRLLLQTTKSKVLNQK